METLSLRREAAAAATDPAMGPCNEANAVQSTCAQGAVFDPATGQISIYDPLAISTTFNQAALQQILQ